jgi:PST family polysaccharide transporter
VDDEKKSYQQIIRSTSIVGGATAISILIGLVRIKFFALIVGPAGIGLMGILGGVLSLATTLASLGTNFSGVRHIAAAAEDNFQRENARRALWLATWPLALGGGLLLVVFAKPASIASTGTDAHQAAMVLLGLGTFAAVIAGTQAALLQGYRRLGDLARLRVYSLVLATLLSLPLIYVSHYWGAVIAVAIVPLASVLVGALYLRRGARPRPPRAAIADFSSHWRSLIGLGLVVMLTGLLVTGAQVAVRSLIAREAGLNDAGLFQAAFAISATNVALVLTAMAADYFPRLSAVADDGQAVNGLVHQQLRTALLLGGPLLVGLVSTTPLVLTVLYSSAFTEAADLLRWQLLGDFLKLPGWALGFVLVARGDRIAYALIETCFALLFLASTYLLYPRLGLEAAGLGYFVAYAGYSVLMVFACRIRHSVSLRAANLRLLAILFLVLGFLVAIGRWSDMAAGIMGLIALALFSFYALRELKKLTSSTSEQASWRTLLSAVRRG